MERNTMAKWAAGGAAFVALGSGAFFMGEHHGDNPAVAPAEALAKGVSPQSLADAEKICETAPYTLASYQDQVGQNLIKTVGTEQDPSGHPKFASSDAVATSKEVASALAPNNLAIADIATILNGEVGISQNQVASDGMNLAETMQKNENVRKKTCAAVIGRVLQTPLRRMLQSSTGKIAVFKPNFTDGELSGQTADSRANGAPIDVFTVAAVHGSPNDALQESISKTWGVDAAGDLIKEAQDEGVFKVDKHGNPVKITTNTGTTVPGNPHEQSNENAKSNSSNTKNQKGKSGASLTDVSVPSSGGGGSGAPAPGGGPSGCIEGHPGCPGPSKGGGGGGGETPTSGQPTPTTEKTTPTTKPVTPTTVPQTTPTTNKGAEPPADCVHNPFDPRC